MENNKLVREYAVYLIATSNELLNERLNKGETIEGMLKINFELHELAFTFGERLAFQFSEYSLNTDKVFDFSDGTSFYRFSAEKPEFVKVVN